MQITGFVLVTDLQSASTLYTGRISIDTRFLSRPFSMHSTIHHARCPLLNAHLFLQSQPLPRV